MAQTLAVDPHTVKAQAARGQIASVVYNDKGQRLYPPPQPSAMIPCARCGTPIPERGTHGQRKKYCGPTCNIAAYTKRRQAAGWKRPKPRR